MSRRLWLMGHGLDNSTALTDSQGDISCLSLQKRDQGIQGVVDLQYKPLH